MAKINYRRAMNYNRKRLPPFGKALAEKQRRKEPITKEVLILAGSGAWEYSRNDKREPRLLLPFENSPREFWWPVKNCDCVVFRLGDVPDETIRELGYVLLAHEANKVIVLHRSGDVTIFSQDQAA